MFFDIDLIIVVSFLLVNLAVGLYYGRNVRTINDYALGGNNFNTATLTATIVATWIGGSGFALSLSETYTQGLWYVLAASGYAFNLLVVAYLLNRNMSQFRGSISVAEAVGKIYGKRLRIITAIASIASTIAVLSLQIKVFASVFSYFFEIPVIYSTMVGSFVVIVYSAFGGIKAVTFTDVVQMVTFGVIIPVFAIFIWKTLGQNESIELALSNNLFNYQKIMQFDYSKFAVYFSIFLSGLVPALNPTVFQRLLMAKNSEQIRESFSFSFCICLLIHLMTCFIGFVIYSHNQGLDSQTLSFYVIDNYSFSGIKSIAIVGIMAMIMSTADSWINSASIIFSHDLCVPLGLEKKNELKYSKLFALFLGVSVVILTMQYEYLLSLLFLSENFYIPVVTPILILSILGFRTREKVVLTSVLIGIFTTIMWKNFIQPINGIESVIPGMLSNLFSIFILHYLSGQRGGWVGIAEEKDKEVKKNAKKYELKNISELFRIDNYDRYLPKQQIMYIYFAIAVFLTAIITLSIDHSVYQSNRFFITTLQVVAFAIATFFICIFLIPEYSKIKYLSFIWICSIFTSFGLISNLLILLDDFSHITLIILTLQLAMIPLLVGWRMSLFLIILGATISFTIYSYYIGTIDPSKIVDLKYKFTYILLMIGGFSLTVLKNKEEYHTHTEKTLDKLNIKVVSLENGVEQYKQEIVNLNEAVDHYSERVADQAKEIERLGATAQKILNNVNHELRLPVGNVMNFAEMLYEGLGNYSQEQLKELTDEVYQNSTRLSTMILNMLDLATLDVKKVGLVKSTENFSELVRDRVKICRNIYLQGKPIDFKLIIEPEILISIDPNYMRQVVDNLVINAINFSEKGTVEIEVRRNDDAVVMTLRDQGKGIPREELFDIFKPFKMGSNSECQSQGRGVGLALCKSAVEAHGGSILAESPGGIGALFTIILMR